MNTRERISLLSDFSALFEPWTGPFESEKLHRWLIAELGHENALDEPIPHGPLNCQALAPTDLLHIVSGNTPHAAFQSLLRGLVVGAHNTVKLPSTGLPVFERAVAQLPDKLRTQVILLRELPDDWPQKFRTIVVFGSDETLTWFKTHSPPTTRLLLHGQKLSVGLVSSDLENAAYLAARDVSMFDQQGCLSIHDLYLTSEAGASPHAFAELLAVEMENFNQETPRTTLSSAESGEITALRESVRFLAASQPKEFALWQSAGSTDWTIIFELSPTLKISPLNRVVYLKPWPASPPAASLGAALAHISTLALHPFDTHPDQTLLTLGARRICPLGETHNPSLFWHHDGLPPLASLITWIDLG